MRSDGRAWNELRPLRITRGYLKYSDGSALVEAGDTRVLCTANLEDKTPAFLKGTSHGWVTAEYGMLPGSTPTRSQREASKGRPGGRTFEIQRLIGRSLRAVVDLAALGERTLWVDCDVIQADGGTRTASITGAFVAVVEALDKARQRGVVQGLPVRDFLAATSAGIVEDTLLLDLAYDEDSRARVDMNLVMTGGGHVVEIQSSGEGAPFSLTEMERLISLAREGIASIIDAEKAVLGPLALEIGRGG
ncbi:MAG: ribonuclease PH [Firmicutes bacterium]|nr:ribonuclease PH [Bacillota bacterium]